MDGEKKWINPYEKSEELSYQSVKVVASSIKTIDLYKISTSALKTSDLFDPKPLTVLDYVNSNFPRYNYLTEKGFTEIGSLALMESNFDKNKALFLVDELNATPEQILAWAIDHKSFYTQYPEFSGHRFTPIEVLALVHLNFSISEILRFSDKYSASQIIEFEKNPLLGWPVDVFEDLIPIW